MRPISRPTVNDMYHDVGMYHSKPFEQSLQDLVSILDRQQIVGKTMKGAQVSANAGPTHWMGSNLTVRIRKTPEEQAGLHVDDNAPRYANWYCTMGRRAAIPIDPGEVEIIVNSDTPAMVHMRTAETVRALHQAGQQVAVRGIDDFLADRYDEIAAHLPVEERTEFAEGLKASPLWAQKAVGDMAARRGDAGVARFYQTGVAESVLVARDRLQTMVDAPTFIPDFCSLSAAEQLVLAERFGQDRTYAVESVADGYVAGHGLAIALHGARTSV